MWGMEEHMNERVTKYLGSKITETEDGRFQVEGGASWKTLQGAKDQIKFRRRTARMTERDTLA